MPPTSPQRTTVTLQARPAPAVAGLKPGGHAAPQEQRAALKAEVEVLRLRVAHLTELADLKRENQQLKEQVRELSAQRDEAVRARTLLAQSMLCGQRLERSSGPGWIPALKVLVCLAVAVGLWGFARYMTHRVDQSHAILPAAVVAGKPATVDLSPYPYPNPMPSP